MSHPELPPHVEMVLDVLLSPETDAFSFVARNQDGSFMASEVGTAELGYEDLLEVAAYQLISLEDQVDRPSEEILKDVVRTRNELAKRPKHNFTDTSNRLE